MSSYFFLIMVLNTVTYKHNISSAISHNKNICILQKKVDVEVLGVLVKVTTTYK